MLRVCALAKYDGDMSTCVRGEGLSTPRHVFADPLAPLREMGLLSIDSGRANDQSPQTFVDALMGRRARREQLSKDTEQSTPTPAPATTVPQLIPFGVLRRRYEGSMSMTAMPSISRSPPCE